MHWLRSMEPIIRRAIAQLLAKGVSKAEIADALGIPEIQVKPDVEATILVDEVPREWYRLLAELAWERGGLERLVHELEAR